MDNKGAVVETRRDLISLLRTMQDEGRVAEDQFEALGFPIDIDHPSIDRSGHLQPGDVSRGFIRFKAIMKAINSMYSKDSPR